ncbi:MAG: hypothetical protein R3C05_11435 [Pirellulaceae bacterium]
MRLHVFSLVIMALLISPAIAEEKEKKGKKNRPQRSAAAQILKQLEPVGLTEEQTAKVNAIFKAADEEMKQIRTEAGITPELMKKRAEVAKSMADSDLKGKERAAAIDKEAGMNEAQAAAMAKLNTLRTKLMKETIALLSAEQKEKLPKQFARAAQAGNKKPGGKKKKDAA